MTVQPGGRESAGPACSRIRFSETMVGVAVDIMLGFGGFLVFCEDEVFLLLSEMEEEGGTTVALALGVSLSF